MRQSAAIIPAAGLSLRFDSPSHKPFVLLGGRTILSRTIERFAALDFVSQVIVALHPTDMDRAGELTPLSPKLSVIAGGDRRQDTVRLALRAVRPDLELVIIHDAARPLVSAAKVRETAAAAEEFGAAILAVPVSDTVKRVENHWITETVAREQLWLAQTPQAFHTKLIVEAHDEAYRKGTLATDDAQLVEALGRTVRIVPGSRSNLKITTVDDLAIAEALLRSMKDEA